MSSVVAAGNDFTVTNGAFLVLESLHPCMPFTIESPKTTTLFFLGCSSASVCAGVLEFGCGVILVFFVFALFLELPGEREREREREREIEGGTEERTFVLPKREGSKRGWAEEREGEEKGRA